MWTRKLIGLTVGHLPLGRVRISSEIRSAVSGSDDRVGLASRSRLGSSPGHRTLDAAGATSRTADRRIRSSPASDPAAASASQVVNGPQAGGFFRQRVLAQRPPHGIHVLRPPT